VIAPSTETKAETFVWYRATPRLQVGLAHLWKQNALRFLASANLVPESARGPAVNASLGVQGIGTGNPGFSLTAEKNWLAGQTKWNAFLGVGFRWNEDHAHPVGGLKYSPDARLTLGYQHDGHGGHPFVLQNFGQYLVGFYLIEGKSGAVLLGARF
jgi:hypothetical protein